MKLVGIFLLFVVLCLILPTSILAVTFLDDDFETYAVGSPGGAPFQEPSAQCGGAVVTASQLVYSGTKSLRLDITGNTACQGDSTGGAVNFLQYYNVIKGGTGTGGSRLSEPTYMRVYVRFSSNYVFNRGHQKLFYLWSLNANQSGQWRVPIFLNSNSKSYAWPEITIYCGYTDERCPDEHWYVQNVDMGNPVRFYPGIWYCIELMAQGDSVAGNGKLRLWVDGVLKASYDNAYLRHISNNWGINSVWLSNYWGGGGDYPVPHTVATYPNCMSVYYDAVKVSDSYIGPLDGDDNTPPISSRGLRIH
jgi:hypothetical protein